MKDRDKISKITEKLEQSQHKNSLKKQKKERVFTVIVFFLIIIGLGVLISFYLGM